MTDTLLDTDYIETGTIVITGYDHRCKGGRLFLIPQPAFI
jgi:hypothetical protein